MPRSPQGKHLPAGAPVVTTPSTSVHLELWLNGTKMVDYTDRDHPYTKGYMGLYVETISDASSTAAAEFDNFTAAQIRR